ncbi:MAG: hypothetical protein SOT59_00730 [Eubacteriales bacterium]|nr:hypothetical protein [Clostridia bacterium]MDY2844665.1 hypothetical protein [Eubacteriales bacterium]
MLNKNAIEKMLEMPDDKFIMMLNLVLGSAGIDMGSKKIDGKTVKKIRALLKEVTDDDIARLTYLVGVYNGV